MYVQKLTQYLVRAQPMKLFCQGSQPEAIAASAPYGYLPTPAASAGVGSNIPPSAS